MDTRTFSARAAAAVAAVLFLCAALDAAAAPTATSAHPERSAAEGGAESKGTPTATPTEDPFASAAHPRMLAGVEELAIAKHSFSEGLRLEAAGDLRGAADSFERAYDADQELPHAGVNAGLLRERLGDDAAARAIYARVLDENPGFGPAVRSLIRLAI